MAASVRNSIASSYAQTRVPRYVQVASALRRRIKDGHWRMGDKIATLEELESEFHVARVTVRQAIELLQKEGLVKSHQGKGTFVTGSAENHRWLQLATDWESLIQPISRNIPHFIPGEPPEMNLDAGEGTLAEEYQYIRSVQMSGSEPYALASVHVAKHVFDRNPTAFRKRIALAVIDEMSDLKITRAHQTLQIGAADIETALHLKIPLNAPTAEARCIVTDDQSVVIYCGDIIYRGDRVKLNIELLDKRKG